MTTESKRYIQTVGRRKTSVARVRITPSAKASISINEKELEVYFPTEDLQAVAMGSMNLQKLPEKFKITVLINGGGIHSQAEALRHGIARAIIAYDAQLRIPLKRAGFLKRDPRAKERRKFGLKKARKAPAWSKR